MSKKGGTGGGGGMLLVIVALLAIVYFNNHRRHAVHDALTSQDRQQLDQLIHTVTVEKQ